MLRNFKLILLILIGQCVCDVNVHLTQESNGKSEIDIDTNNRGCSPQHEVAMGGFSKAKVFANRGEKAAAKERIKNTWGIKPEQNYTMERYREQIVNGANYLYEVKIGIIYFISLIQFLICLVSQIREY